MIEDLSEEDFLLILNAAETIDGVVVGGQALNLWAKALFSDDEFDDFGPFTSKDIDFWGTKLAAEDLAKTLHGKVILPDEWSDAHSEAAVKVTLGGQEHQIDFLHSICGLKTKVFLTRALSLEVEGVTVAVLHPLDVLKTREAAVRVLRRTDKGAVRQLRAAPVIAIRFIETLLDSGDLSQAQDDVRELIDFGSSPLSDPLFVHFNYDPLALAAEISHRHEWQPKFAEFQIRKAAQRGIERRCRRVAENSRRLKRHAS